MQNTCVICCVQKYIPKLHSGKFPSFKEAERLIKKIEETCDANLV